MPANAIKNIRKVENGYIVEARWPFGGSPAGFGEVVCTDLLQVLLMVSKSLGPEEEKELDRLINTQKMEEEPPDPPTPPERPKINIRKEGDTSKMDFIDPNSKNIT